MTTPRPRPPLWQMLPPGLRRLLGAKQPPAADCGMGMDALPQGVGRLPVGTPVALGWQGDATSALWAQALLQDLLHQGPLMVLAEFAAQVDPWLAHPELARAHATGQLQFCLMGPALQHARRPQGMQPVWDELERAGLGDDHALLMLAAPRTHLGASVAQAQQWGRQVGLWCRTRRRPVVVAFDQWDNPLQVLSPLRGLASVFEHVALLGSEARHSLLFVAQWNGDAGPLFEARFGLRTDALSQRLVYDGSLRHGQQDRLVEAPDLRHVYASAQVLAGQRGAPAEWQVVEQDSGMLDATREAQAATVLLAGGSTSDVEGLLRLVFNLRNRHGRTLKIVVRETQDKLRSNLEQALLCLGANSVVYREVGFARLVRLVDELSDSTYARELQSDFDEARAGFMPDAVRGYLPPRAFCDHAEAMLERTSRMGLRHSLLRLSMQPHVAHVDAVRACLALRDGDVLTADHDSLWVFMFACAESDTEPALARLFSIPPAELFAAQTLYGPPDAMRDALHALRQEERAGLPDYSALRSPREGAAPRAGTGALAAPQGSATAPAAVSAIPAIPVPVAPPPKAQPAAVRTRPLAPRHPTDAQGESDAA